MTEKYRQSDQRRVEGSSEKRYGSRSQQTGGQSGHQSSQRHGQEHQQTGGRMEQTGSRKEQTSGQMEQTGGRTGRTGGGMGRSGGSGSPMDHQSPQMSQKSPQTSQQGMQPGQQSSQMGQQGSQMGHRGSQMGRGGGQMGGQQSRGRQQQSGGRQQQSPIQPVTVSDLAATDIVTARPDDGVTDVVRKMATEDVGAVVIVEGNRPVGIVTDRKITLALGDTPDVSRMQVSDLMTEDVFTVPENTNVFDLVRKLSDRGVRRVPVVDDQENLQGIVSLDDAIVLLAEEFHNVGQIIRKQSPRL